MEVANNVRMFNNEAFDSGGGLKVEHCVDIKSLSESIEYDSSKENHNPLVNNYPASFKTPVETAAFCGKSGARNGIKVLKEEALRDEGMIDKEIEKIETEMHLLSLKLESLKREKLEMKKSRIRERRRSIVPAKYMDTNSKQIPNSKSSLLQKAQDSKLLNNRRGVSLCPAEIYSATKQSRRQSCFWKPGEIDELKLTKARGVAGKSASVSPKPPRRTVPKLDASKKAVTTKKLAPKNDGVLFTVQPKKLFKESEKPGPSGSASVKKPFKTGRVIPSRYNPSSTHTPESVSTYSKTQSLCESENRVKKRWEIPDRGNVVVYMSDGGGEENENESDSKSTVSGVFVDPMVDLLKKIRTVRCVSESPRDSGAVKRVADLVGKKSFFADSCQALSFVDEEEREAAEC